MSRTILRPLLITGLSFLLALALERFGFPSFSFPTYAGNSPHRVVYSELQGTQSVIWSADPADPMQKRKSLLTVSHQDGYGLSASLSADGSLLAYGFLPPGKRDAFSDGQLWLAALDGSQPRLLSTGMDLHVRPIWSPDNRSLLFKTVDELPSWNPAADDTPDGKKAAPPILSPMLRSSLAIVSVEGEREASEVLSLDGLGLYPIGWSRDGRSIFYYSYDPGRGAEALVVDRDTLETRSLGRLGDGAVWSVQLSPDFDKLLFVQTQMRESGAHGWTAVFDLETGTLKSLSEPQSGPLGAAWNPSGESVTHNGNAAPGGPKGPVLSTSLAGGPSTFLREDGEAVASVPVSWSPDAVFLAIRRLGSAPQARSDSLALLDSRTGQLREIKGGYADLVGWANGAR